MSTLALDADLSQEKSEEYAELKNSIEKSGPEEGNFEKTFSGI